MKSPKDGWVQELADAESDAKTSRSAGEQLRLAIAAYKLRLFKKMKTSADLELVIDPSDGEKKLPKEYVEKCNEQYKIRVDMFTHLNILQFAVLVGDVTVME
jgi:hypothetical protein